MALPSEKSNWVPERNFRAYRRINAGTVWLIVDQQYYEVSGPLDAIWQAVDGSRTVSDVAQHAMKGEGLTAEEALNTTLIGLQQMVELELIEWIQRSEIPVCG